MTQYSRDSSDGIDKPRRTGSPAFAGDDGLALRRYHHIIVMTSPHVPTLLRRQRHTSIAISNTITPTAIAPLMKRPPGRSMVRDHSDGASPGRARRNATTLSPMVVPDSE